MCDSRSTTTNGVDVYTLYCARVCVFNLAMFQGDQYQCRTHRTLLLFTFHACLAHFTVKPCSRMIASPITCDTD